MKPPKGILRAWLVMVTATSVQCCSGFGRPFTAEDDIGLSVFPYAEGEIIKYAPDGQHFVVVTERGRLDLNAPEDTIWLFRTDEVRKFMEDPKKSSAPAPIPLV